MPCLLAKPLSPVLPDRETASAVLPEMVGLTRFELVTPRLSSVCSNQLSYRPYQALLLHSIKEPVYGNALAAFRRIGPLLSKLDRRACQTSRRIPCQIDLLRFTALQNRARL
jgi:hypothetical protein